MNRRKRYDHLDDRAREVVRFDRFYVRRAHESLKAAMTIHETGEPQLGVFHELLTGPGTPAWLSWRLGMDPSYLSRTLKIMEDGGYVSIRESLRDRRERQVGLTDWGLGAARNLEWFYEERARKLLDELPLRDQERLVRAMAAIVAILQRDWVANLIERIRDPA